jgi:hypothetical protein
MLFVLAALLSNDPCDLHALFSCQSEFTFVSGEKGPGPEDAAHFQTLNDAQGNAFCAAASDIEVPGTQVRVNAGVALLEGKNNFSLATMEGNQSRGTPYNLPDQNTIHADIALASQPDVVFSGKTEKLQTLSVTCRLTP